LLVATHTLQTHTERLPAGRAFASTLRVMRMATGMALDRVGTVERPVVSRDGELWVYSYASGEIDAGAHAAQLVEVVPEMCGRHVGPSLMGIRQGMRRMIRGELLALASALVLISAHRRTWV
jgi:hypothetical protein